MKKTKIITRNKSKLQSTENFIKEYETELEKYVNNGYEIKASNLSTDGVYAYIYTLLEIEE